MQILRDFREKDWVYRRSSGYPGYARRGDPKESHRWVYQEEYIAMKTLKADYEKDLAFLHDFRRDCLSFGDYPDKILLGFLDEKYKKIVKEKRIDLNKFI